MQNSLQKASLTSQSQEPLFATFKAMDKIAKKKDQDSMKIDLSGQVFKKFDVSKLPNTTELSTQSEICLLTYRN